MPKFVEIANTTVLYIMLLDHISELDLLFKLNIFKTLIRLSQSLTENPMTKSHVEAALIEDKRPFDWTSGSVTMTVHSRNIHKQLQCHG
jgi:hypothetical protein